MSKTSKFDYIAYDEEAKAHQAQLKLLVAAVEDKLHTLANTRYISLALTSLEECYMWAGKATRDDQLVRNNYEFSLEEERSNS
jgi:hypothetical protein